ncbi:sulfite exporter TauE/SafE family protein [Fulvivirgaceae bacterium BMA12]|uniref:Sulfite exporter TauE/SafE family protein n=1 Tax=Agaribacillus aureus TaxID=3051825 RepID=A0ABT8LC03_9BACT|nr:sulfite exporter TauE/SafE family protein [Fulvivirgaceae bacterium BMA12]
MTLYWMALVIGVGGSVHCLGMCGPIALAIPVKNHGLNTVLINRLIYNLGRVTTYGAMGLVVGVVGLGIEIAGIQKYLSIILGASLIFYILFASGRFSAFSGSTLFNRILLKIKALFAKKLSLKGKRNNFLIGMLNGLLPCGLVYVALVNSLLVSSPWEGFLFMMVFGLGTIPALVILPLATRIFNIKSLTYFKKFVPFLVFGLGIFLIFRGLNFDDPFFTSPNGVINSCLP